MLPSDLPVMAWRHIGEQIALLTNSSAWWLGDWIVFGQDRYPDSYRRLIDSTSLDYQTLRNYAWVARRFPLSRRRDKLSFQHHAEVAPLPEVEQDRLLDLAAHERWSRNRLRSAVRAARSLPAKSATQPTAIQLTAVPDQHRRWQEAAQRAGLDLLAWIASTLDDAARLSV